ncbi:MAG: 30S ribosomal protein S1 [Gemmatimonadetes bacterium]|nr:30S ribosomal protein S1 [Gemmatimonadota bacterium]MBT6905773.1 30S ribosomal protein S1 [Gemmatimonadota bacterium]MBT7421112.1 30S ribosomal protein S1 [Gemmatimonadota bacterium]
MTEETTAAEEPQEKPIYGNVSIEELEKSEYDEDQVNEFMALYEESISGIKEGQIVKGTVVSIGPSEVMVDIGFKSEGAVSIKEFSDPSAIEINQEVEVFLENVEDQEGQVVLSKQKADFMRVWDSIKDAHDTGNTVEGRLMRRIKGGIVVDLFGVEAFLPGSQIDIRQVKNFDQFIGQEFPFKIIKLNKARRNIVVSRRAVLEEERGRMREEIIKVLEEGQVREGVVKNITDFGAFIDLGGVDGLLHITDMSWGRVNHPSELVSIGDRIKVKVLNYDRERERISLGLKQLTTHPWENIEDKYPIDGQIRGKVVSITDYGAFVELEEGIEGLVHISEMSWTQHVRHPSKLVNIGDSVEVMVLKVDSENQKISLGMKQTEEDPWETLDSKYPPGTKLEGTVRSLTNFGAFVEIEDNIDGLVHISDMSWTKRIRQASEMFKKGDEIPVTVTEIDIKRRRISLSHKMAFENPWPGFGEQYAVGTEVKGAISRILERGVVVSLIDEVDGFVPLSQLAIDGLKNPRQSFEDGQELPLKVIEFDQDQKKIVLSAREYFKDKDQADYEGYLADHPIKEVEPVEEAVADKDDEMESWGDAHDGGAPPAESAPVENDAADEDDDE